MFKFSSDNAEFSTFQVLPKDRSPTPTETLRVNSALSPTKSSRMAFDLLSI
jgi:hypothetical protein